MQASTQWYVNDVESAIQGDSSAYSTLIEKSMSMVTSIAMSIVNDLDASEDVAQQVYITIWKKLHSLKNPGSFLPWLRQTTRHTAFNYIRDNKAGNLFKSNKQLNETEALLEQFQDEKNDPESSLNRQQQSLIIADLISNLPEQSRDVVILYYREEQSTKQVAALLGLSEANVRQRLSRARTLLRSDCLSRYGKLIMATLPPLGFAAIIGSSLTVSSPLLAAGSAAILSGKSTGISKLLLSLGGAGIGLLGGLLGVRLGIAPAINRSPNEKIKNRLKFLRKITSIWVIVMGLAIVASYAFSRGWVWPVTTFTLFFAGITLYVRQVWSIAYSEEYIKNQKKPFSHKFIFWSKVGGYTGYILGAIGGFGGLFIGLINSGRLTF